MEMLRLQAISVNVSLVVATLIKCGQWGRDVTETFPETQCLHWPNKNLTPDHAPNSITGAKNSAFSQTPAQKQSTLGLYGSGNETRM